MLNWAIRDLWFDYTSCMLSVGGAYEMYFTVRLRHTQYFYFYFFFFLTFTACMLCVSLCAQRAKNIWHFTPSIKCLYTVKRDANRTRNLSQFIQFSTCNTICCCCYFSLYVLQQRKCCVILCTYVRISYSLNFWRHWKSVCACIV